MRRHTQPYAEIRQPICPQGSAVPRGGENCIRLTAGWVIDLSFAPVSQWVTPSSQRPATVTSPHFRPFLSHPDGLPTPGRQELRRARKLRALPRPVHHAPQHGRGGVEAAADGPRDSGRHVPVSGKNHTRSFFFFRSGGGRALPGVCFYDREGCVVERGAVY